jgi:hypothetical protein
LGRILESSKDDIKGKWQNIEGGGVTPDNDNDDLHDAAIFLLPAGGLESWRAPLRKYIST